MGEVVEFTQPTTVEMAEPTLFTGDHFHDGVNAPVHSPVFAYLIKQGETDILQLVCSEKDCRAHVAAFKLVGE